MDDMTCERMRELAPELALGVLSGRERAQAQEHLDQCPACREEVSAFAEVGDRLLAIVPSVEPPVGFEDRVLARLDLAGDRGARSSRVSRSSRATRGPLGSRPTARDRRRWLPIAVAAVAALVFGVGGWAIGNMNRPTQVASAPVDDNIRSAVLWAGNHQEVGQVVTYQGTQPWLYLTVDTGKTTTTVSCELQRADGTNLLMGRFTLVDGKGAWGGALPADPSLFRGANLLSPDGTVLAAATFGVGDTSGYGHSPPR
jgi:anti-sigma-K factor RskA